MVEEAIRALRMKHQDSIGEQSALKKKLESIKKEVIYRDVLKVATSFVQLHISEMDTSALKSILKLILYTLHNALHMHLTAT